MSYNIVNSDGSLKEVGTLVTISADKDNAITKGTDGGLFVDSSGGGTDSSMVFNSYEEFREAWQKGEVPVGTNIKIVNDERFDEEDKVFISKDTDNAIVQGSDKGWYVEKGSGKMVFDTKEAYESARDSGSIPSGTVCYYPSKGGGGTTVNEFMVFATEKDLDDAIASGTVKPNTQFYITEDTSTPTDNNLKRSDVASIDDIKGGTVAEGKIALTSDVYDIYSKLTKLGQRELLGSGTFVKATQSAFETITLSKSINEFSRIMVSVSVSGSTYGQMELPISQVKDIISGYFTNAGLAYAVQLKYVDDTHLQTKQVRASGADASAGVYIYGVY